MQIKSGDGKATSSVFRPIQVMRKWIIKTLMFISIPLQHSEQKRNPIFTHKQTMENAALKTKQQAHGSSSTIIENALIIDECFLS